MMKSLTRVLVSNGLEWKDGSLAYLQFDAVAHAEFSWQDDIHFEISEDQFHDSYLHDSFEDVGVFEDSKHVSIPRVHFYECLGTHVDENGDDVESVTAQLIKAHAAFLGAKFCAQEQTHFS